MMHDSAKRALPAPTFHMRTSIHGVSRVPVDYSASPVPGASEATPLVPGNAVVWSLFWSALTGLLAIDVFGLVRNFARMRRFVGEWRVVEPKSQRPTVLQVCTAINYACVWYPKRVLCLQRSIATTCLLRSSGIPASMIVGAQTLPFKAHAWTEVDGNPVNERRAVKTIYDILERC